MADIAKLIYKKNTLYGGESGDIKSSNDTYDDIVFLTQAEYDALPSKNPNTLYSTPEGGPAGFDPSNTKTFYISSTSDLAAAQEAYDWYVAGNNPIIVYTPERSALNNSSGLYLFSYYYNGNDLVFVSYDLFDDSASYGGGRSVYRNRLNIIADSSNVVTEIERNVQFPVLSYLSKSASNGEYTPSNDYDPATKKYVDDKTGGLSADHLEEQCTIGELYTNNDMMLIQNTPKLDDCTLENCKVGDVAADTEIHIQRIASGTASNKLKLKVKKVGSPTTTLKVEVRSGIQVTVTANKEAYWYGDSSDILATGSIAYSSITTNFQEIEVTLSASVGGNKGDLLDVVCYQDSSGSATVDSSNYYILACDSIQCSEAFSFVSVNGSSRVRSKYMPYCSGAGFMDSLLCKIPPTSYRINAAEIRTHGLGFISSQDRGYSFGLYKVSWHIVCPDNARYCLKCRAGCHDGGSEYDVQTVTYLNGNSGYVRDAPEGENWVSGTTDFEITSQYNTCIGKYWANSYSRWDISSSNYNSFPDSAYVDVSIEYNYGLALCKPRSSMVLGIGNTVACTTLGRHIDGTFIK